MNFDGYQKTIEDLNSKALYYYENGDLESATEVFEKLLIYDPYIKDTYFNLGKLYFDKGQFQKTVKMLLALIDLGDEDDSTFELLGDAYLSLEDFSNALFSYKRVKNNSQVKEKIKVVKQRFETYEDKVYKQYMSYPYPNRWSNEGIPKTFIERIGLSGPNRRISFYVNQFIDVNYIQFKYLEKYKPLNKIRILNAGCGTGEGLLGHAFLYPEAEYMAIDISEQSINIAKEHAKKLKIENVTFIQKDISKLKSEDLGYFDIIISTGVLHHLYNPAEGILNLKKLLKDDGILVGMVYATIGRREVYDFRGIAKEIFSDVEQMEYKIENTKELIRPLEPWQNLNKIKLMPDFGHGDQGMVDLLLNANETSYNTKELIELFESLDMKINLHHNNYLNPLFYFYNINSPKMQERLKLLDKKAKMRVAEIYNGSIFKHHFISYKKEFVPKGNYFFDDNWFNMYPVMWHGVLLKKDKKGYFVDMAFRAGTNDEVSRFAVANEYKEKYIRYDIDEIKAEFLKWCTGKESIREIAEKLNYKLDIKEIRKLLFELNKMDILFLSKEKEEHYNG